MNTTNESVISMAMEIVELLQERRSNTDVRMGTSKMKEERNGGRRQANGEYGKI